MKERKLFVSNSPESTRIFKSNFLEFFSKCPWYLPFSYWIPIISFMIYVSVLHTERSTGSIFLFLLLGFCLWSILEYVIHRFVFHWEPKKKGGIADRLHFLIHGFHHDYPNDKLRLVAPPLLATTIAIPIFILYFLLSPDLWVTMMVFSGTIVGYLIYDYTHYFVHHANVEWNWAKRLKKHHFAHHYDDDHSKYGISVFGIFWDYVFKTLK